MELKWIAAVMAGILLAALCIWLFAMFVKWLSSQDWTFETASRRAGRHGEEIAAEMIHQVLKEDDRLLTNIEISYNGKKAEMDSIVVNRFGVFIFEVKNYRGQLIGNEDDYEWQKIKITGAGNMYVKQVRNPIRQLKRQVYLLAHYLQEYRIRIWVEGYAILLHQNSPVDSGYIISSLSDIDKAIHTKGKNYLHPKEIEQIIALLQRDDGQS
ncbi:nuclease-related domain-containing protein [Lachnospiraceae bacterium 45-W7]